MKVPGVELLLKHGLNVVKAGGRYQTCGRPPVQILSVACKRVVNRSVARASVRERCKKCKHYCRILSIAPRADPSDSAARITLAALPVLRDMVTPPVRPESKTLQQCIEFRDWSSREWASGYAIHASDTLGYWLPVEGSLPKALSGTFFRNAPGRFHVGHSAVAHPFDGDGLVSSVSFHKGHAFFRSQFVDTNQVVHELREQKRCYPGTFGTHAEAQGLKNMFNVFIKNVANTNIVEWGGRAWALFEAGQPHELDPYTLSTIGCNDFGLPVQPSLPFGLNVPVLTELAGQFVGALHPELVTGLGSTHLLGGYATLCHPKVDPETNRLISMRYKLCISLSLSALPQLVTQLEVREMDQQGNIMALTHFQLKGYGFVHDMAITPNYYIVFQNPVELDIFPLVIGQKSPVHCVDWNPQKPTVALLIPRPGAQPSHRSPSQQGPCSPQPPDTPDTQCSTQFSSQFSSWRPSEYGATGSHTSKSTDSMFPPTTLTLDDFLSGPRSRLPASGRFSSWQAKDCDGTALSPMPVPLGEVVMGAIESYNMPAQFVFHVGNGFEVQEHNSMIVDYIGYPEFTDFHAFSGPGRDWRDVDPDKQPPSRMHRLVISLESGTVKVNEVNPRVGEFPSVSPKYVGKQHKYIYMAGALHPHKNRPQQAVAKVHMETGDVQHWSRGWHYYVGEPVFVPSSNSTEKAEDDGWVIAMCYDAQKLRSELVILDARDVEAGPVAVLPLKQPLPHGLHGSWSPTYYGPPVQ